MTNTSVIENFSVYLIPFLRKMSNERKTKIDLNDDSNDETRLHYGINETPPLITTLLFAVQVVTLLANENI